MSDDPSRTPTGLDLKDSKGLFVVNWADGNQTQVPYRDLRLACHCALCVDELTNKPLLDPETVPTDVGVKDCREVGLYGVQIEWTTGHGTGIYSWDRLRTMGETGPA